MSNTSNRPIHSHSREPQKIPLAITSRQTAPEGRGPQSRAIQKQSTGWTISSGTDCSFGISELKLIIINKFAGNLRRRQPGRQSRLCPINKATGLARPAFLWSRSFAELCNCCLIGETRACPSNRCKFPSALVQLGTRSAKQK